MKRRLKPKQLLLSTQSERSIRRVMGALAIAALEDDAQWKLRKRAIDILDQLRGMT